MPEVKFFSDFFFFPLEKKESAITGDGTGAAGRFNPFPRPVVPCSFKRTRKRHSKRQPELFSITNYELRITNCGKGKDPL